jgi:hypothetical protein
MTDLSVAPGLMLVFGASGYEAVRLSLLCKPA